MPTQTLIQRCRATRYPARVPLGPLVCRGCHLERTRFERVGTYRESLTVVVTGDPADTVSVSLGSPQRVAAVIAGVREVRS